MSDKTSALEAWAHNAINALLDDIRAAWAANDADRLALALSEGAIFVPFNGSRLLSRTTIAKFHARPFASTAPLEFRRPS